MPGQIDVILVAAGRGERFVQTKNSLPKQFIDLGGMPLFMWSLRTIFCHPAISQIVLMIPEGMERETKKVITRFLPETAERIAIIKGGATRQESVFFALEALANKTPNPQYVLIHDAVRPFVTAGDIDQIISQLDHSPACTLATPLSDSIKRVKDNQIVETLERQDLFLMQTPQAASFQVLFEAHKKARANSIETTDDAAIIQASGGEVTIVLGSPRNFKITEADDMSLAQALYALWNGSK